MSARDRLRRRAAGKRERPDSGPQPAMGGAWSRPRLLGRMKEDPAFQVMTIDGLNWIDPFTRQLIPAAFEWQQAAADWLLEHRPWRQQPEPLSHAELLRVRWALYIRETLPNDDRLRLFLPGSAWVNPLDASLVSGVKLVNKQVGRETLAAMASAMAKVEQAGGSTNLRDQYELKQIYERERNRILEAHAARQQAPATADTPTDTRPAAPRRQSSEPFQQGGLKITSRHGGSTTRSTVKVAETRPPGPSGGQPPRNADEIQGKQLDELRQAGYVVGDCLGRGGMAAVFKATQLSLEREVALKVRLPGEQEFSIFVERFLIEARSAAKIAHPNVVTIFDVGRTASLVYMALEYLPGGDLDHRLQAVGRFDPPQALGFVADVLAGLKAIHAHGMIHRDIKTANLFLSGDDLVKVGDLGIARDIEHERHITNPKAILGTPAFMPPEQSVPGGTLDQRSDLYSVGVVAFHLLSGRLPYDHENPLVILRQIITEDTPDLLEVVPDLNPAIAAWVQRLMHKEPGQRPQNAQEALDELKSLLG